MVDYVLASGLLEGLSLEEAAAAIAGAGFRGVELMANPGHLDEWVSDAARARRVLAAQGIAVPSVHSPVSGWDNDAADLAQRLASVEETAASFDLAAALQSPVVVCHPNASSHTFLRSEWDENTRRSRLSLEVLAQRAEESGVKMAVENLPQRDEARPGAEVGDLLELIEGLGDHVGICLDVGHCNISGTDPCAEAQLSGERLFVVHLQDNEGVPGMDRHWLPGRGTIDWPRVLATLDMLACNCVRTLEVGHGDTRDGLLAGLAKLRNEWCV